MSQYSITIFNSKTEIDFLNFAQTHTGMEVLELNPSKFNNDIYDENGDFKWINLANPKHSIPKEYMEWRITESQKLIDKGEITPLSETMLLFENHVKELLGKE